MNSRTLDSGGGLLASLRNLAGTLIAVLGTRLDLLSVDLEEELQHAFSLLILTLVALFWTGIGVVLTCLLLIATFWDTHRLIALAVLAGFSLSAGAAVWIYAARKVRGKPRLFAASLAEFDRDRDLLDTLS